MMEMLSEHQCDGWLEGYLLTGPARALQLVRGVHPSLQNLTGQASMHEWQLTHLSLSTRTDSNRWTGVAGEANILLLLCPNWAATARAAFFGAVGNTEGEVRGELCPIRHGRVPRPADGRVTRCSSKARHLPSLQTRSVLAFMTGPAEIPLPIGGASPSVSLPGWSRPHISSPSGLLLPLPDSRSWRASYKALALAFLSSRALRGWGRGGLAELDEVSVVTESAVWSGAVPARPFRAPSSPRTTRAMPG